MDELINDWEDATKTLLSVDEILEAEYVAISSEELEEPYEPLNFKEA